MAVAERDYLGRLTIVGVANEQAPRLAAALDMKVGGWKSNRRRRGMIKIDFEIRVFGSRPRLGCPGLH